MISVSIELIEMSSNPGVLPLCVILYPINGPCSPWSLQLLELSYGQVAPSFLMLSIFSF